VADQTKAPTGLAITRDGLTFKCTWKYGDDNYNDGTIVQFKFCFYSPPILNDFWEINPRTISNGGGIWVNGTEASFRLPAPYQGVGSYFYPDTYMYLHGVMFIVKGKKPGCTMSDEASVTFNITAPNTPKVEFQKGDAFGNGKWKWSVDNADSGNSAFLYKVDLQTRVEGGGWTNISTNMYQSSGTYDHTETISVGQSVKRYVRARAWGVGGITGWVEASHTFAHPQGLPASAIWRAYWDKNRKYISVGYSKGPGLSDYYSLKYKIANPAAGFTCPDDGSWSDSGMKLSPNGYSITTPIDTTIDLDKCMWIRFDSVYDGSQPAPGEAKLVTNGIGKLTPPILKSVDISADGTQVEVTVTNKSAVPDSKICIMTGNSNTKYTVVPSSNGEASMIFDMAEVKGADGSTTHKTGYKFGIFAFQGKNVNSPNMVSDTVWEEGTAPCAATDVSLEPDLDTGDVLVHWNWAWDKATEAQISWSEKKNAWVSNKNPDTYEVSKLNAVRNKDATKPYTHSWTIAGLDIGKVWYFMIQLLFKNNETTIEAPYSDMVESDMATTPETPTLEVSTPMVATGNDVTFKWTYASPDKTAQASATIYDGSDDNVVGTTADSSQTMTITQSWEEGSAHNLYLVTTSETGKVSEKSNIVTVNVVPKFLLVVKTGLVDITDADGNVTGKELQALPLNVLATGAGAGGKVTVAIERDGNYVMSRPNEIKRDGFDGETIAAGYIVDSEGKGSDINFERKDIFGYLDDTAKYKLVIEAEDQYGQEYSDVIPFTVNWNHKASKLVSHITKGVAGNGQVFANILVDKPADFMSGDVFDVYRLSIDGPIQVLQDCEFGKAYVDPYPTFGEFGGYRIVMRTCYGDYLTEDKHLAWTDVMTFYDENAMVINFEMNQVKLPYNLTFSNSWSKDFKQTVYLNGSVVGDWNPGVTRQLSANTDVMDTDSDTAKMMRKLSDYPGLCHVRTPEGSSFAADIQTSESRVFDNSTRAIQFSLNIQKVDPEGLEGLTLEDWEKIQNGLE